MDDIPSLIRELRVDWEKTLDEDFNPLPCALALSDSDSQKSATFKDMYHKLDETMTNIIEKNYQGFSDFVLLYGHAFKLNQECYNTLQMIIKDCQIIKNTYSEDFSHLSKEKRELLDQKKILEIYKALDTVKNISNFLNEKIERERFQEASTDFLNIYDLTNEYDLKSLKCYKNLSDDIISLKTSLLNNIFKKIKKTIFSGEEVIENKALLQKEDLEDEYIDTLGCLIRLGELKELDIYFYKNFSNFFFEDMQKIIYSCMESDDKVTCLVKKSVLYILNILKTFEVLISLIKNIDKTNINLIQNQENYFEVEIDDEYHFFGKNGTIKLEDILIIETKKFLEFYSKIKDYDQPESIFSLDNVLDTVDYSSIFLKKYAVSKRMENNSKHDFKISYNKYFSIFKPTPEVLFLFYENIGVEFPKLKENIRIYITEKYIKIKDKELSSKINDIILSEHAFYCDFKNQKLIFFEKLVEIVKKWCNEMKRIGFFDNWNVINQIFVSVLKKYKECFLKIFKCNLIIKSIFKFDSNGNIDENIILERNIRNEINEKEEGIDKLTRFLMIKSIYKEDLIFKKNEYLKILITIDTFNKLYDLYKETIKGFEKNQVIPELEALSHEFEATVKIFILALNFELIVESMYFYIIFFRECTYDDSCNETLQKIFDIFKEIKNAFKIVQINLDILWCLNPILEIFSKYSIRYVRYLNVNNLEDLNVYIEKIELIEEIFYGLGSTTGMTEWLNILKSTQNNKSTNEEEKILIDKISRHC
ncbi:putative Sec8 exocyst complex protein [Hamiltosporidium tvaerminnensis]|uniref:Putative Sec8 exocyst complex protein n=1 Tax=Hamiltosporidium tvaerminnensis TaxID=1176355 RepID=A0A4Q9L559_9MICR|nr:exocyst subunit [Hamiltosporidium tvaerminnensis]TBU02265.1 putative Sec8 exocyst complex protein [Hamiltosporidium tvaerminnensis]